MKRTETPAQKGVGRRLVPAAFFLLLVTAAGCSEEQTPATPTLNWYIFDEPSGAFVDAAASCSENSGGSYSINLVPLPTDADQQREQLVRRLAARDSAIDIIGMDVIWTAEFAEAGWILPWPEEMAAEATKGHARIAVTAYPILYACYLSLFRYDLRFPDKRSFIGIDNYISVLTLSVWWEALLNTVIINIVSVGMELLLGMVFALIMHRAIIDRRLVRSAVLISYGIITVVAALIWKFAFIPSSGFVGTLTGIDVAWFSQRYAIYRQTRPLASPLPRR